MKTMKKRGGDKILHTLAGVQRHAPAEPLKVYLEKLVHIVF